MRRAAGARRQGRGRALVVAVAGVAVAVGGGAVAGAVLQHAQQRRQQLAPQRARGRRLQLHALAQHLRGARSVATSLTLGAPLGPLSRSAAPLVEKHASS